jgi:hypothetical protein
VAELVIKPGHFLASGIKVYYHGIYISNNVTEIRIHDADKFREQFDEY